MMLSMAQFTFHLLPPSHKETVIEKSMNHFRLSSLCVSFLSCHSLSAAACQGVCCVSTLEVSLWTSNSNDQVMIIGKLK